ncbi:signal transduction histidine kinase [Chitinophaga pinensis DSM 2588]|uniref:histidine kinase n=2 Tax=Chitinophaga pinensis TaxID=79329 RepID=A0A979G991_CHIPD|nr:signal transduction histidine kinase [Chitinophaga pinensis DSM 2588]
MVICQVILLLLASFPLKAQDLRRMKVTDFYRLGTAELLRLRNTQPEDSVKARVLIALGQRWEDKAGSVKGDIDTATQFYKEAELIISSQQLNNLRSDIALSWGYLYYNTGQLDKARQHLRKAIDFCRKAGYKEQLGTLLLEMAKSDPEDSISLPALKEALAVYSNLQDRLKEAEVLKEFADFHFGKGEYELAEKELLQVLQMYQALHYDRIYYTYDLLSAVYQWKGDFARAQENAMAAISSAEKAGDVQILGLFYWRLAAAYQGAKNYAKYQEFLKKSLLNQLNNPYSALTYHVLGELTEQLIKDNKVNEALGYLLLTNKRQPPLEEHQKVDLAFSIADCYLALKDYTRAEQYYLKYADLIGEGDDINRDLMKISQFYIETHRHKKAEIYLQRILKNPVKHWDLKTSRNLSLLRFRIDSAAGNLLSAVKHLQQYNKLTDSAFTIEKLKQAEEMQAKFDLGAKERDNQLLRKQSSLQREIINKETLVRKVIMAGCIVLLLLLLLLYNRYRNKIKTNAMLQKQQEEIRHAYSSLEKMIGEKSKLLREKEFLIKEIHHRVKNNLQLTMSLLNTQSKYLHNEAAIRAINDSQYRLKSISMIHQKLYQGEEEGQINIKAYICEMLEYLKDSFSSGERIRFHLDVDAVLLDAAIAVPLGLILNEAITNIFKYAFPGTQHGLVEITLHVEDEMISFAVKDNGAGLPAGFDIATGGSLGFELIKVLSAQLDAVLNIDSKNGVQIYLQFQINTVYE